MANMEQFIDLVRQLPCLWDMDCREYRDMRKKYAAWKRIVQELKSKDIPNVLAAKAEWKKLRDNHRDSLKRSKSIGPHGHNQDSVVINKWKYAEHMQFLLPYMKTRRRKWHSTISSDENNDLSPSPSDSFLAEPSTSNVDNITFSPEPQNNGERAQEIEPKMKRRHADSGFAEIMIDTDDRGRYSDQGKHPLDSFFESMCETTKQFPTWLQYSVKRKIFNIISEAEDTFESYKSREPIF